MIKLYKREADGTWRYHEAWQNGEQVTEHWGQLGTRGESKKHRVLRGSDEESNLEAVLAEARARGFAEVDEEDHRCLLVEYAVDGMGHGRDVDKRHALEARLNELLGWTGLGHCDGGSIGSGTMEACCFVIDFVVARQVIEQDLRGTELGDYTRIYDEDAE